MRFVLVSALCGLAVQACGASEDSSVALEAASAAWMADGAFNGVLMLARDGDPIFHRVDGLADPGDGRALTADTRFQTGSVDKYFTAAAVFVLVEQGRLDLDAPIAGYLPEYRADTGAQLTLRSLLSNQSGLPNDILAAFRATGAEAEAVDQLTLEQGVARYASGDLLFAPGERFDYVLSNWLLLHHLVATVTGQDYSEAVRALVFEPAGMSQSGAFRHDMRTTLPPVADVAIGFDPTDPDGRGDYRAPGFFAGSYTTARDLLRLDHALSRHRLFGPERLAEFRTLQVPADAYAFGGRYREWTLCGESRRVSAQSGSNGATTLTSAYDLESGVGVAMLTNVDHSQGAMFALSAELMEIELGCSAPAD